MHNIYKSKGQPQTMQEVRIKYLQEEIEKFPDEPFNYYGLALEYSKKDAALAENFFEQALLKFPNYLPTYYQAANFFFVIEDYQRAETIFLKGIELAKEQNNTKTLKELQGSYSIFKSETEDEF